MRKSIYRFILYIALFAVFYPEKYTFFPVSTIWIFTAIALMFSIAYFAQHKIWHEVNSLSFCGLAIFLIGVISAKIINQGGDLILANRGIQIISYSLLGLWVSYLMIKVYKEASVLKLLEILINLALIQAIISFVFLLLPSIAEFYRNFVTIGEDAMGVIEVQSMFRLVGIGDMRYATAAVNYGFMIWAVLLLRHHHYGLVGTRNWYSLLVITIFSLAGILSGRTFFILMVFTVPYVFCLKERNFIKSFNELFSVFCPVLIVGFVAFVYLFASNEQLVSWAFEIFINLGDGGKLESESTNQLRDMYIFPSEIKTWFFGDGKTVNDSGGFYMGSDVGYIRSIFYWGIIGTCLYLYIQYYMVRIGTNNNCEKSYRVFLSFLFIFFLVYWLKDLYSIEKLICLFVMVQAMSYRMNQINNIDEIHNSNTRI